MTIDERIKNLEKKFESYPGQISGTQITRILLDKSLVIQYLGFVPERESFHCWSLGLGGLVMPKKFFYGITIEDCINNAETSETN